MLSIVVLFGYPYDAILLDEALFSLATQDHEQLDVILVLPDAGLENHRRAENAVRSQPWPAGTRARVTSVLAPASRTISPVLVNVGLAHAVGRYIALVHHQDLVYQHAYRALIGQLRNTEAAIAFGGVRVARHSFGYRHWMVTNKASLATTKAGLVANRYSAIHSFVADRDRLDPDYLVARQPESLLAMAIFLLRLALHPEADFSLTGVRMFETRIAPHLTTKADLGRLPSSDSILTTLAGASLRSDAVSAKGLLAEVVRFANPNTKPLP